MAAFETNMLTVGDLFSSRFVFVFPDLQRPFRWTGVQVNQLLDDLLAASGLRGDDASSGETYFLGGVVLVAEADRRRKAVIDGRQRLTTLAMLICALRDLEDNQSDKDDLHRCIADEAAPALGIQKGFRLEPQETDARGFDNWVFARGATLRNIKEDDDVSPRLYDAISLAQTMRMRLRLLDIEARRKLAEYVLQKVELVAVTAPNATQGRRIFTVLNTRGLDLSEADSIKPALLERLEPPDRENAFDIWDDFDARLAEQGMDELLRTLMFIYDGDAASDDYKDSFLRIAGTVGFKRVAISDIPSYGQALWRLRGRRLDFDHKAQDPNIIVQGLEWLPSETRDWIPAAAHIVVKTNGNNDRRYALLKGLDRYCFVALLLNYNIVARRRVFSQIIRELNSDIDPLAEEGALSIYRDPAQQVRERLNGPLREWRIRPAIVRRLEAAATAPNNLHPDIDKSTVEHVLPRRPNPHSSWTKAFSADDRGELTDTLGNFVLLSYGLNQKVANAPFGNKKREMFQIDVRPYRITADLDKYLEWTPAIVRNRTKYLAEMLLKDIGIS